MLFPKSLRKKTKHRYFVFELTSSCNQNCLYCYNVWKYHKYPRGIIDVPSWKKIVSTLKNQTSIKTISLSGGEPLLYSGVFELIEYIINQRIKVNFLTNGSLIDEEMAKKLVGLGVSVFEIPLVAPNPNLHKRLKGKNDFEKVIRGITNIKYYGGQIITVFVATNLNIKYLKKTVDLGIALGSSGLMFNRINPACKNHILLMPTLDQLKEALELLNNFSKKYDYPISSSIPIQPCLIDMKYYPNISTGFCPSRDEHSYFTIDYMGNVRICNHSPDILGNILRSPFNNIVESNKVVDIKKAYPCVCSSCKLASTCYGGCKAAAQVCFGSLTACDPFLLSNSPPK